MLGQVVTLAEDTVPGTRPRPSGNAAEPGLTVLRQILQRLLLTVPVLLGVLLLGFVLMQVVPNDPAVVRAGPTATKEVVDAIRGDLGLDRRYVLQFLIYLGRLLRGDLGVSIINNIPVAQELGNTIGPTLELSFASLVWAIPLGILLGTVGATRRGTPPRPRHRGDVGGGRVGAGVPARPRADLAVRLPLASPALHRAHGAALDAGGPRRDRAAGGRRSAASSSGRSPG